MVYIYNEVLFSHEEKENLAICNKMDETQGLMLSEMSEKDKFCLVSLICGILKKEKLIETQIIAVVARDWVMEEIGRDW